MKNKNLWFGMMVCLLALSCLLPLASCSQPAKGNEAQSTTGAGDAADEYLDDLGSHDFKNEKFKVLSVASQEGTYTAFDFPEDYQGDQVDDAVFSRNRIIEKRFNVLFDSYTVADESGTPGYTVCYNRLRQEALAPTENWDLVMLINRDAYTAIQEGLICLPSDLRYLDMSKDYYLRDVNDALTIDGVPLMAYEAIDLPMITDKNYDGKPYGTWKAGDHPLYYLSDLIPDGIPAMNGNVELPADSKYLTSSNTTNDTWKDGQPTTKDYPYGTSSGTPFTFGAPQFEYTKGIGMHPKNPNAPYQDRTDSWTLLDISEYTKEGSTTPANTFYALVGLTAAANEWGSLLSCQGLYVYIYGDKTGDGENFEFLAASGEIISYQLGEFNVDVTGVKTLLIQVILQENATSHGYSAVGFGDACLFLADENAEKPDYSRTVETGGDETESGTSKPEDKTTAAPTDTSKPADSDTTTAAPEDGKQSGGCASGIGLTEAVLLVPALAGIVCFRKRRKHE